MLVAKEELKNVVDLLRVKRVLFKRNAVVLAVFMGGTLLLNLVPEVIRILQKSNDSVSYHVINDHSFMVLLIYMIAYLCSIFLYRTYNELWSAFPQTNQSRFMVSQLYNMFTAAVGGVLLLLLYIIQYGVLQLISRIKNHLHFVYEFDIAFLITGFCAFLLYSFIIVAFFGLVNAIMHKWSYKALTILLVIVSLFMANLQSMAVIVPKILSYLIAETVPFWFFIKALLTWLVIVFISLVINRHTIYYKSISTVSIKKLCLHIGIAAAVVALIQWFILASGPYYLYQNTNSPTIQVVEIKQEEFRFDISHLPRGSKLNIEGSVYVNDVQTKLGRNNDMVIVDYESVENLQGDTLRVYCRYNSISVSVDDVNIWDYAKERMEADLIGDSLILSYHYNEAHVVFMPVWSFASPFEEAFGKNLCSKYPFMSFGGSGSDGGGHFILRVE